METDPVLHRPILKSGSVIGYLWCTGGSAGFLPRTGAGADDEVCGFWMRWLRTARAYGLSPRESLTSWDPGTEFPHGTPASGAPNSVADVDELRALAEGGVPEVAYPDETSAAVRHYEVIRADRYIGRVWTSLDDVAAGYLPRPDLPGDDPAAEIWRRRLSESCTSGLTPTQALNALKDAPDDGRSGHIAGPPGRSHLRDL